MVESMKFCEREGYENPAAAEQFAPVANAGPSVHDRVVEDLRARKALGLRKYGTVLQAHNGRDALMDAYQETLDLACYLRQALDERHG